MSKKGIYFFFEREKIFTFAKKISYRGSIGEKSFCSTMHL